MQKETRIPPFQESCWWGRTSQLRLSPRTDQRWKCTWAPQMPPSVCSPESWKQFQSYSIDHSDQRQLKISPFHRRAERNAESSQEFLKDKIIKSSTPQHAGVMLRKGASCGRCIQNWPAATAHKQIRFVSVKAERPTPSRDVVTWQSNGFPGGSAMGGGVSPEGGQPVGVEGGGSKMTCTWLWGCPDFFALGLKTGGWPGYV